MTHKCVQILVMGGVTAYCEKVYVEDILCQVLLFVVTRSKHHFVINECIAFKLFFLLTKIPQICKIMVTTFGVRPEVSTAITFISIK